MSVEFEATAGGMWLGLDAYSTEVIIEIASEDVDDGVGMTLGEHEARRLRRFLEYVYPASEDR